MPGVDPIVADLENQIQTIMMRAPSIVTLSLPSLTMSNKDDEIADINDFRARFNTYVDQLQGINRTAIQQLNDVVDHANAFLNGLDPTIDAQYEEIIGILKQEGEALAGITVLKARNDQLDQERDLGNRFLDYLISNIKESNYVMGDTQWTEYESDGYTVTI